MKCIVIISDWIKKTRENDNGVSVKSMKYGCNSREIIELEKNLLFQTRTAFFEI